MFRKRLGPLNVIRHLGIQQDGLHRNPDSRQFVFAMNFHKTPLNIFIHLDDIIGMTQVSTSEDIERKSKGVISSLYGDVSDFRINATFQIPEKGPREAWDVQVNFMLNDLKYTVDLEIQEKDGQVTNARLIDTMTPL